MKAILLGLILALSVISLATYTNSVHADDPCNHVPWSFIYQTGCHRDAIVQHIQVNEQ
jgi:hypothetical protein